MYYNLVKKLIKVKFNLDWIKFFVYYNLLYEVKYSDDLRVRC